jgi:hypothetical protein
MHIYTLEKSSLFVGVRIDLNPVRLGNFLQRSFVARVLGEMVGESGSGVVVGVGLAAGETGFGIVHDCDLI